MWTAAWKRLRFILSVRSDFHIIDSLLIAVHAFVSLVSMSFFGWFRRCFLGTWICLLVLSGVPSLVEMSPVWFIAHIFRFVCINIEAYACCCSFQTMQKSFGLVRCICQYRYVIGVVGVGNCCCGVSSASFLRQFEAILFDFVNRCSKYVVFCRSLDRSHSTR